LLLPKRVQDHEFWEDVDIGLVLLIGFRFF